MTFIGLHECFVFVGLLSAKLEYEKNIVFLVLKKVGFGQYEDFDSKPGVGDSMHARLPANTREMRPQLQRGGGGSERMPNFRCLLVIYEGTFQAFQAVKELIFH